MSSSLLVILMALIAMERKGLLADQVGTSMKHLNKIPFLLFLLSTFITFLSTLTLGLLPFKDTCLLFKGSAG